MNVLNECVLILLLEKCLNKIFYKNERCVCILMTPTAGSIDLFNTKPLGVLIFQQARGD